MFTHKTVVFTVFTGLAWLLASKSIEANVVGWLNWRGPGQNGVSREIGLPEKCDIDGENYLWSYALSGRGTPVIADDKLFAWGYRGDGPDFHEVLVCLDANTGKLLWERQFSDFLSDIIYRRYAIGSPTVDRETGNIYLLTTPGLLVALDVNGLTRWQRSLMEEFGRLTFPNGRTGSPVIDSNLVIVRGITTNWGKQGPARDRFYAFDKSTGAHVWASTPGVRPTDSSFSTPVFTWLKGKRVFYCGTGCGNIVCVNARTGEPLSRFQLLHGGINSSVLLYQNNSIIAIHGKENIDTSEIGRMVAVRMDRVPTLGEEGPIVLQADAELWRNPLDMFTSSPVLVDNRIYQVTHTGNLCSIDAETGRVLWKKKLSNSQLHASPLYADGKLYIPVVDGSFHILRPTDQGAEELNKVQLDGKCLGSPAVWNGKIYVLTTARLYCFGNRLANQKSSVTELKDTHPEPGSPARLLVTPSEVLLRPGERQTVKLQVLDPNGYQVDKTNGEEIVWKSSVPDGAKVQATLNAKFIDSHTLEAKTENIPSAGMYKVTKGKQTGYLRGRILPRLPIYEDFESFDLTIQHANETGIRFAYPPLPWIGARFKWEIRELNGNKVLAKTLDRVLFQRTMTFIGHADMNNYTVEVDVMSEGNRRIMSTVGVINQRYIIALKGNWQQLEIVSNHDLLKVGVPFTWQPNTWYRLKTRVDVQSDGSGIIRAKAWERNATEPEAWTVTVPHKRAHLTGAPGLFGFSPQSKKRVYIDSITVTSNED